MQRFFHEHICFCPAKLFALYVQQPPWPNGQGVGLLIQRLRVRVPQGVLFIRCALAGRTVFHSFIPSSVCPSG